MRHKKGVVTDLLFFGLIIFILSIVFIVGAKLNDEWNNQYQASDASTEAKEISDSTSGRYVGIFDALFLTIMIMFGIAIFVTVFMLDTHPMLFFIVIILFAVVLLVIAMIGNSYEKFSENSSIAGQVANLGLLNYMMDNWLVFILGFGIMAIVLLFARAR